MSAVSLSPVRSTPEFDLLCLVARPRRDLDRVAAILRNNLNWSLLLNLAAAHGIRPQLVHTLRKLDWLGTPREVKHSLLDFLRSHNARSLFIASQLVEVTELLSHGAIRFATFKGPSLAAAIYGDLSLRECNDIDIIVDEHQVPEAETVLASVGYKPAHGSPEFRAAFLSYQKQFMLVREDSMLAIDLHWDFTWTHVPFPLRPSEIWSNLEAVEIGGRAVPTLGRNDLALFLAGHGTKEGWKCLGWVCDFAMLIEKYPDLDWNQILGRAQQRGCGRSLLLGARLAAELLGIQVKGNLLKLAENANESRLAAEAILRRMRNEAPVPSSERFLGDLYLCETHAQKGRVMARTLMTRTVGDYLSMPLPRYLWPLYRVTRPFRLIGKVLTSFVRPSSSHTSKKLPSSLP